MIKKIFKHCIVALTSWEARLIIAKYKPTIIAVTGSVGKTSTKDSIYTALNGSVKVRKSEKSFNSEVGVPLTILGRPNSWNNVIGWAQTLIHGLELILFTSEYPECLVLEVGADHPGDIKSITRWLKPDVTVVTRIGDAPVHVEFFPSQKDVVQEKSYLVRALKTGGTLVLSADDEHVLGMKDILDEKRNATVMTFGLSPEATVSAQNVAYLYADMDGIKVPIGMEATIKHGDQVIPLKVHGALGVQFIYPIIAAVTVAVARKVPLADAVSKLADHVPARGRMNVLLGTKQSILIDDTYNSSPDAIREALNVLKTLECSGRRIAILGDMLELGKLSVEEHRKAGTLAAEALGDQGILIAVGVRAKNIAEEAAKALGVSMATSNEAGQGGGAGTRVYALSDAGKAAELARSIVGRGDVVLVKGSQSIRLERVSAALLIDPSAAPDLLVRHESEWLAKK